MLHELREILSGHKKITEHIRYESARIGISVIHIMLLISFFCIGCLPIAIFNCFSVFFYVVIAKILVQKEKYIPAFVCTYLEVVLHSFFACIIVGWNFSFSLYNISLIYIAYYFAFTSSMSNKKIILPTILGLGNLVLTFLMRAYTFTHEPLFTDYSENFSFFLSAANIFIVACMIMFFASFHTAEVRRREYELLTINMKLDRLAHFDALTRLRNRHSMEEELHAILDKTEDDYCFIMGDIDDFKQFNDTYGHACGDFVLKTVADIVLRNMENKHIACRWGGEEILILVNGNLEYTKIIAEKIRFEIDHMKLEFDDMPLHITMTFGVSPCIMTDSFEKCISSADTCLYQGKQTGKNCVISAA